MAYALTLYVVCFDITDDSVRRKVVKYLLEYGDRVQYSVFELAFKRKNQLTNLQSRIKERLEMGDEVRFYRLCANCKANSLAIPASAIAHWPAAVLIN